MASTLQLKADKSSLSKGDNVNISWTSVTPDSLVLVVDDGDTVQRIQVPDSGSRLCWSNRAQKDMSFTLIGVCNGRKETTTVKVKVKDKSAKVKDAGIGRFQMWKERTMARLSVSKAQFAYAWASMKKWQKALYAVTLALPLILLAILLFK
ncbi:MAG: hypothetical protein ACI4TM_06510 [Candidatus Cryptobacteroides sp.]